MLSGLPPIDDPNVLVGTSTADDAGVYRLTDEIALVQTVDFFTPIVDDPNTFGGIAAANALSDVYAMGGKPLSALAIAAFPASGPPLEVLAEILRGGFDKAREAGVPIIGGHTVKDPEPKYGLAVTGIIHPRRVLRNSSAQPDDVLVLTKCIGTGILTTAYKQDLIGDEALAPAIESMLTLNRAAADVMLALDVDVAPEQRSVHAVTDVTGFGLIGHLQEMARGSGVGVTLRARDVPLFDRVLELAADDVVPGGTVENHRVAVEGGVEFSPSLPAGLALALCDAQTSGGLLISVAAGRAKELVQRLREAGVNAAVTVGNITGERAFRVA